MEKSKAFSFRQRLDAILKAVGNADYLAGNLRSILIWPIAILLLIATGWTVLLTKLNHDRQELERYSLRESATLSQAYADHLARNFDSIDQIALHVKFEWELSGGTLALDEVRKRGLFPSTELVLVTIVDKNGVPVTSTVPIDRPVTIADREHFKIHKNSRADSLHISKVVVGRLSGKPVIQFSRKLVDDNGGFAGVVVVSVDPAFFALSFDFSSLGVHGVLAALGEDDMQFRVTRIGQAVSSPAFPALVKIPEMKSLNGSMRLHGEQWFADKRTRFVSWQTLPSYPLIAIAGLDEEEMLAPYLAKRATAMRTATIATAIALIIAVLAMATAARFAWVKYQSDVVRRAYRMATDIGSDGFYICQAIYDDNRHVVDFCVVDCNRRGAEMIGRPRELMIGRRVSALYPPPHAQALFELGRKAMEVGAYEDEYHIGGDMVNGPAWIHRTLLRSGDSIAVTVRDISDAKRHIEELERRGNEDALTTLHNRHWLHSFLPGALERAKTEGLQVALLYIDIDGFKAVNDAMGHAAGDELLRLAATRLKSVIRPQDRIVRLGGDEFLIILETVGHRNDAAHVAERVLDIFGEKFKLKQGIHTVGVSVGIGMYPDDGQDAKTLLQNADIAMYSAKQSGKGHYRFYDPAFYDNLRARLEIERKLREAVDDDQFEMFYQPRIDMETGRVCGLEALMRWNHPDDGLVEPLRFITIAEETGLILNLGKQAMEKVCAQIADWSRANQPCVPVSINVSPRQFHEGGLKNMLASCLARHDVAPDLVEIEVTESSMMGESEDISMEMEALQKLGVKLLVDDFGTGYSSLSQLQRLDMDGLKIDRAFTSELGHSEEGEVFFTAIVTMAHALGMRVVAEGVETREQVEILKRLACDEIQGFYVSRPVPADAIPALMDETMPVPA